MRKIVFKFKPKKHKHEFRAVRCPTPIGFVGVGWFDTEYQCECGKQEIRYSKWTGH